jgi:hypothetical protein
MKKIIFFLTLIALCGIAKAQSLVNCAPGTACNSISGPANTGTGDPAWTAFGKINADISTLWPILSLPGLTPCPTNTVVGNTSGATAYPTCLTSLTVTNITTTGPAAITINSSGISPIPFDTPEWHGYVNDTQAASVSVTTAGNTTLSVGTPIFSSADCLTGAGCTGSANKIIIISGAGSNLLAGASTYTLTHGSTYTNGTYAFVPLTCVTCADPRASQAFATITVSGNQVTGVNSSNGSGQIGYYYTVGDVLTTPNAFIGGTGSGFQATVTTTANAPLSTTITGFTDSQHVTLGAAMNSVISNNTCGGTACQEYIWWGGKSGAGGINDAGAAINAAWNAGAGTVYLNNGYYALLTTLVPPAARTWHLICNPGAVIQALSPLNAANSANLSIPYNSMLDVQYPPAASSGASFKANVGSTVEGCLFDGAFVVQNGAVDRAYKIRFENDIFADMWGGTTSFVGPGAGISVLNHGEDARSLNVDFNNGTDGILNYPVNVTQSIGPAHCMTVGDTDTQEAFMTCGAYAESAMLFAAPNAITANVSSSSPNLVVTSSTGALHTGDYLVDNNTYGGISGGQNLIPAGAYVVSGPVNGMMTPFFTTTITCNGSTPTIATGTQALVAGEEVVLFTAGTYALNSCTGLYSGRVYYVNSTGLTTTAMQLCAQPSCSAGSITPGGTGTATPIGQGIYTGTSGTFVMSANATGNYTGDTVKVGLLLPAIGGSTTFQPDGSSGPHVDHVHAYQSGGMTALGNGWQVDSGNGMYGPGNQVDNSAANTDSMNIRGASNFVAGFYSNSGPSYYPGTRAVRIDPSINTNPQNNTIIGTLTAAYGGGNPNVVQDNSSGHSNLCLNTGTSFTACGTQGVTLSDDNGPLLAANDPNGASANYFKLTPSIEAPLAANIASIGLIASSGTSQNDLNWKFTSPSAPGSSGLHGGDITIAPGAGDGSGRRGGLMVAGSFGTSGTVPTIAGTGSCASPSAITGGANGGKFTCASTGAGTITVTFQSLGGNNWFCYGSDLTTQVAFGQTTSSFSATTCSMIVTVNATSDTLQVYGFGY